MSVFTEPNVTTEAMSLLADLEFVPQVVGYDHRVAELHDLKLIQWAPGQGYTPTAAGRRALADAIAGMR